MAEVFLSLVYSFVRTLRLLVRPGCSRSSKKEVELESEGLKVLVVCSSPSGSTSYSCAANLLTLVHRYSHSQPSDVSEMGKTKISREEREKRKEGGPASIELTSDFHLLLTMWALLLLPLLSLLPLVNAHGFITSHKTRMVSFSLSILRPAKGGKREEAEAHQSPFPFVPSAHLPFLAFVPSIFTTSLERLPKRSVERNSTLTGMARGTETVSLLVLVPSRPLELAYDLLLLLRRLTTPICFYFSATDIYGPIFPRDPPPECRWSVCDLYWLT